ncbi:unnamed protein product, partial [Iphiclides podalirius]
MICEVPPPRDPDVIRGPEATVEIDSDDSCPLPPIQRRRGFTAKEKRQIMRDNVSQVLLNSTLTPFRWLQKNYRCFFCRDLFKTPKEWREHQNGHDTRAELAAALDVHWESTVYVDVSRIACRLCAEPISELHQLIDHLVHCHGVNFNREAARCLTAYKLDDEFVHCVLCERRFRAFSHALVHAHREHKGAGEVLCEVCGQSYKSIGYLRNHIRSEHSGGVECTKCAVKLRYTALRSHMQREHGQRYACNGCGQAFATQYKRACHSMLAHGDRQAVSCHLCPRTFLFRSTMQRHLRQTHLRERDSECAVCGWRSFGGHALKKHMLSHSTARDVQCPQCGKGFKSGKTMKQHCANVHKS